MERLAASVVVGDRHQSEAALPRPTLTRFVADVWEPKARRRLAPKTWERDRIVYRKHIRPRLGERPIASLDIEELVVWQDELEEAGVGEPTIAKAIGILSSIFGEAAQRPRSTGVSGNPVALLDKPKARRRRRPRVWGPVVVERVRWQLLTESRRVGPDGELAAHRDALLVSLMAMTGCRPGEALGLRWSDVGPRIAIVRRLSGKEIRSGTKGGADRHVPLLAPLHTDLTAPRHLSGAAPDDFLFRTRAGRHWVEADWRNYRSRHFATALRRIEVSWDSWRWTLRTRTPCAHRSPVSSRRAPTTSAATRTQR